MIEVHSSIYLRYDVEIVSFYKRPRSCCKKKIIVFSGALISWLTVDEMVSACCTLFCYS